MTNDIQCHLQLLGRRVKDRVTEIEGIATSICFDLYGCIQAVVNRGMDKDGKQIEQTWYDVARLEILNPEPVMRVPDFVEGPVAQGLQGAADKPATFKA